MTDLMKDINEIDRAQLDKLNQAQTEGEGVRLPFPALYFHVKNGEPNMKGNAVPSRYFGGWEADPEKMQELLDSGEIPAIPENWLPYLASSREGKEYSAIGTRYLVVAVIASRTSWTSKDGKARAQTYSPEYTRQHRQWLGLLLNQNKPERFVIPVILSAKGYQASNTNDAVGKWNTAINQFRKELNATTLGRYAFWLTLGTSGDKPDFKKVGPAGQQSTITPITAIIPEGLTAEAVSKRFIGRDNLSRCVEIFDAAQEWLGAWKQDKPTASGAIGRDVQRANATADPVTGEMYPEDW